MSDSNVDIPARSDSPYRDSTSILALTLSSESEQRRLAANAIGEQATFNPIFLPVLKRLLRDENEQVKIAAISSIGKLGNRAVSIIEHLCQLLDDNNYHITERAAYALRSMAPVPEGIHDKLIQAMKHVQPRVREHVTATLAMSSASSDKAINAFRKALADPMEPVRWYAAAALAEMGSAASDAVPELVSAYLEDVDVIRAVAEDALSRIVPQLSLIPIQNIYTLKRKNPMEFPAYGQAMNG